MLLLFLFANLTTRPDGVKIALNMLALNALIAAITIIAIIGLQIETAVVTVSQSEDINRLFRAIFPNALLVAAGWLLFWSRYLTRGGGFLLLASLICLFSTVIQMHRSTLLTAFVVLLFLFARMHLVRLGLHSLQKLVLTVIAGVILFVTAYYVIFVSSTAFLVASSAFVELFSLSGNSGHRALLVSNSLDYVLDSFGFGVGLHWERVNDFDNYLYRSFVAGPTLDSTYANIIIVYGIPGMLLFLWISREIFKAGSLERWISLQTLEKEVTFFVRPFLVYCLGLGLGTDVAILSANSVVFVLYLIIVSLLQQQQVMHTCPRVSVENSDFLLTKNTRSGAPKSL